MAQLIAIMINRLMISFTFYIHNIIYFVSQKPVCLFHGILQIYHLRTFVGSEVERCKVVPVSEAATIHGKT